MVRQPAGYRAFIPAPLPPRPPLEVDITFTEAIAGASLAVGRLDGIADFVPNPDLFVAMYVRREAVLSSQIEGTQSTLEDVLAYDLDPSTPALPEDVDVVINYVRAMNYGLERLESLPLSLRLIREIHGELLQDVRGADKEPGEFRRSQNWIGSAGATLAHARFVPPPPAEMHQALDNLEKFLYAESGLPDLLLCGLAHAQFETIHPFLDGNGRIGRLLITLLLVQRGILRRPLLYLSIYLKRHQSEYYDRLMAIRTAGDWEGWLRFFLDGVRETAEEAVQLARQIVALNNAHRVLVRQRRLGQRSLDLLDLAFRRPLLNAAAVRDELRVTFPTATRLIEGFESAGILRELTGGKRNRTYRYDAYLSLFVDHPAGGGEPARVETTGSEAVT
jgi:Fic family protein